MCGLVSGVLWRLCRAMSRGRGGMSHGSSIFVIVKFPVISPGSAPHFRLRGPREQATRPTSHGRRLAPSRPAPARHPWPGTHSAGHCDVGLCGHGDVCVLWPARHLPTSSVSRAVCSAAGSGGRSAAPGAPAAGGAASPPELTDEHARPSCSATPVPRAATQRPAVSGPAPPFAAAWLIRLGRCRSPGAGWLDACPAAAAVPPAAAAPAGQLGPQLSLMP